MFVGDLVQFEPPFSVITAFDAQTRSTQGFPGSSRAVGGVINRGTAESEVVMTDRFGDPRATFIPAFLRLTSRESDLLASYGPFSRATLTVSHVAFTIGCKKSRYCWISCRDTTLTACPRPRPGTINGSSWITMSKPAACRFTGSGACTRKSACRCSGSARSMSFIPRA